MEKRPSTAPLFLKSDSEDEFLSIWFVSIIMFAFLVEIWCFLANSTIGLSTFSPNAIIWNSLRALLIASSFYFLAFF